MRQVTAGNGSNSTAAVQAYLAANNQVWLKNLYLIGEVENPDAIWLTDYEAPLTYPIYPAPFQPAVIKRASIPVKIGLEVPTLDLTWSPPISPIIQNTQTASPYQLAQLGYYDDWRCRVWVAIMPTPGDVNTFGAAPLFGGRVSGVTVQRGQIKLTITSYLDVINQQVPTNVIELTNTLAGYVGAIPPVHASVPLTAIPQFSIHAGTTQTILILNETSPNPAQIFNNNELRNDWLVFNRGGSASLGGLWFPIYANNSVIISGLTYNQVAIYGQMPWVPIPGSDTCYIAAASPLNQANAGVDYFGFAFCPSPQSSL